MTNNQRTRPPTTRRGITRKIEVTGANVYVTLNRIDGPESLPCELFVTLNNEDNEAPIDAAHQGWANLAATLASICLQYGCPLAVIAGKMRGYSFKPDGGLGRDGSKSIPDAIGKFLEAQLIMEDDK